MIRKAGFASTNIVSQAHDFTYASEEEWWMTLWSHGMRAHLERIETTLGSEALAKFKAQAFETIQALKTSDGIHQRLPVLYTLATKP